MNAFVELSAAQQVEGRPFTDTDHNERDLAAMRRILASLIRLIAEPREWPAPPQHLVVRGDHDGKVVREVVCNCPALLAGGPLFVVAFLGHRRTDLDTTILSAVDDDLIHEFPLHPGVLSYSSFEHDHGNYVNLVLMDGPGARDHWRVSSRHAYAARDLAPEFYVHVRLQNAVLPRGLSDPAGLRLVATKYYDYEREPLWLAVRRLGEPAPAG
jgi:hypothetical protein